MQFLTTGCENFYFHDMFKMTEVFPWKTKIVEIEEDEHLREIMVSLTVRAGIIKERK